MQTRHTTLTFNRNYTASPERLWRAWTDKDARAAWAAPAPQVTVEFQQSDLRTGGREVSICRAPGMADIRCEAIWLLVEPFRTVNTEANQQNNALQSLALVTAEIGGDGQTASLSLTVQLASLTTDMEPGYREGFGAALDNIARYLDG